MWEEINSDTECHWSRFKSRCHNIDKDVVRTDRTLPYYMGENNSNLKKLEDILVTYIFFNFDLGYVQGMNELLSPILYIMNHESDSYWCFKGVMDKMERNFHKDQNGMHTQLVHMAKLVKCMDPGLYDYFEEHESLNMFFCFRWILIHFKREFSFSTIQRLWEVLWANHLTPNFHLFIALAILLKKRSDIISKQMRFDDILKFINEMSGNLNLEEILVEAENVYNVFNHVCEPSDWKQELLEGRQPPIKDIDSQ